MANICHFRSLFERQFSGPFTCEMYSKFQRGSGLPTLTRLNLFVGLPKLSSGYRPYLWPIKKRSNAILSSYLGVSRNGVQWLEYLAVFCHQLLILSAWRRMLLEPAFSHTGIWPKPPSLFISSRLDRFYLVKLAATAISACVIQIKLQISHLHHFCHSIEQFFSVYRNSIHSRTTLSLIYHIVVVLSH